MTFNKKVEIYFVERSCCQKYKFGIIFLIFLAILILLAIVLALTLGVDDKKKSNKIIGSSYLEVLSNSIVNSTITIKEKNSMRKKFVHIREDDNYFQSNNKSISL